MRYSFRSAAIRHQQGMALIVSLVLLLSMTLLALAAMQNTSLEERMAGNVRSENIALQAAESALRRAEEWLDRELIVLPPPVNGGTTGIDVWARADGLKAGPNVIASASNKSPWWQYWTTSDWLASTGGDVLDTAQLQYVAQKGGAIAAASLTGDRRPKFVIEEDGYQRQTLVVGQQQDAGQQVNRFRITARGVDAGERGEVLLQSRFFKRF